MDPHLVTWIMHIRWMISWTVASGILQTFYLERAVGSKAHPEISVGNPVRLHSHAATCTGQYRW